MTKDPAGKYALIFDDRPDYVYAHLKADEISSEIIEAYVDELVAYCESKEKKLILLIRDVPAALSEGDVFHTVRSSLEKLRGRKLALVNPHRAIQKELEFGITVGQNRGGNYRVFTTEEDAEAWLLSG